MTTQSQRIYVGNSACHHTRGKAKGEYVTLLGEQYYCIRNYDQMPPFFMNLVSSSDHWIFISSTGGLSAGRHNAESALFPYYTDDRITENSENTGHKAILLITKGSRTYLWEPFSTKYAGLYRVQRNLYKNVHGNKLVFEEINDDLDMTYRYAWRTSEKYGFVKSTWLRNSSADRCSVNLVDGLQNLLPYGATTALQTSLSNLLNAYKRNELDPETGLGIFALSSTLTDLAEPSESLKATIAWQVGFEQARYLLSSLQLENMRRGLTITQETDVRGHRGAYLVNAEFELDGGAEREWHIVAQVNQDSSDVVSIINALKGDRAELQAQIDCDIDESTADLVALGANADGLQVSGDHLSATHHFSNVLFNIMRGGIFVDNHHMSKVDLCEFIETRNRNALHSHRKFFAALPARLDVSDLLERAARTRSADLERLCYEYLPLTFSRRHGDPSRPWNRFSINVKNPDGTRKLDYQGNWRDIFQNWEPLACSYPEFIDGIICKFLNATTADGYNPYRVTRDGIEWEAPSPDDPWANIGYWSDHQIIYLQKLLEISTKYHPGRLETMLERKMFSHANVPYRIKKYAALLEDPYDTILFDRALDQEIQETVKEIGTDGKLILDVDRRVFHVNLAEKLLILLLAKLSNFVPKGGIWMNTQRPEWNDANNALVGKGLSVVTVCYLRRFIVFCRDLCAGSGLTEIDLTLEIKVLLDVVYNVLEKYKEMLHTSLDDRQRRAVMDELGQAGSDYRWNIYQSGISGEFIPLNLDRLLAFLDLAQQYAEHTIEANERPDHLYHTYNVLHLDTNIASISYLYEMLEGQVAVLSSGLLSGERSLVLLQSVRNSKMYRADQHSYMLYPDRDLPGFMHKNCLSAEDVRDSALITMLMERGDRRLMNRDENGIYHFNGSFRNTHDVGRALLELRLCEYYAPLVDAETDQILELFEKVFNHSAFTGRSGTFFAYEGLGSIYWHMVSKLLLAAQEVFFQAAERGKAQATVQALADAYYDIRQGIGFNKPPDVYGAFPTDPYSHTPEEQGAKQPGMTGQVKEELLTRMGELGIFVERGVISFRPVLLRKQEFISKATVFEYIDVHGQKQSIELPTGSLAYTFCQVPIVYVAADEKKIDVHYADGRVHEVTGGDLDAETSQHILRRDGRIKQLTVHIPSV
ncbi:MAG: hypothetical protein GY832_21680 [Chloroflexi bacterium]|nr:hypothetical protein [Chloroflexota bacterium]